MELQTIQQAVQQIETNKQPQKIMSLVNSRELLPSEKKILTLKYAAKPFGQLSEKEQRAHCFALMMKINVVTGWPMPDKEEEINILSEQFQFYLIENWPLYNVDEIMYSIRNHATSINNWGKNMNLSLIGQAMNEYEQERNFVSKLEESKAYKQENNLLPMQADWKELCELNYQEFLTGNYNMELWPWQMYDEFVRCGMMAEDVYQDFLSKTYKHLISKDYETQKEKERLLEIRKEFLNHHAVIEGAKRLAVKLLYYTAKEKGEKNLFVML